MEFKKIVLGNVERCCAALGATIGGDPWFYYAGEGDGSLHAFHGYEFKTHDVIWTGGGGTKSICSIRGEERVVLASRGYHSMMDCKDGSIEIIRRGVGYFTHEPIAKLERLHRFEVVYAPDAERYILATTLYGYKISAGDWTFPGGVYCAKLPGNLDGSFMLEMKKLPGEYYVNHGLCVSEAGDKAYIGSRDGIFEFSPPLNGRDWTVKKLLSMPVSDMAVFDIDLDGEDEIAAILPCNANRYAVLKKSGGEYRQVYSYPAHNDFYHVVLGATLGRRRAFIGGARKHMSDFFVLFCNSGRFSSHRIDAGQGPCGAAVLNCGETSYIVAANRTKWQAAVYIC
ncbi:MAG: hypothetical protein Q4D04_04490 [Clostridia bacterium]|nr:hypothetical protein [Clostridia bacterium]